MAGRQRAPGSASDTIDQFSPDRGKINVTATSRRSSAAGKPLFLPRPCRGWSATGRFLSSRFDFDGLTVSCESPRIIEPRRATPDRDDGHARRHAGNVKALSRRHESECERFDRMTAAEQVPLLGDLLMRIADTRTLWLAAMRLVENGEKAPGPNKQKLKTLLKRNPKGVRAELRQLRRAILDGTYRPGSVREVEIPKSSGRGVRMIAVANWQDQVVQRAIVDILQPLLDSGFEDLSYGFRPGRSLAEAKARVAAIAEHDGMSVVITADIRNAFDNVPQRQLLERLRKKLPENVVNLIGTVISTNNTGQRGVPQGGPLSPLLLNVYLDAYVDKKWQERHPECPMTRVADDILILCESMEQAQTCYRKLHGLVRTAGMSLKGCLETDTSNLAAGETAEWLGTTINLRGEKLVFGIPDKYWRRLRTHLEHLLAEADGPALVRGCLQGVMDQLGPCYKGANKSELFRQLANIAHQLRIPEIPQKQSLTQAWRKSAARYLVTYELWRNLLSGENSTGNRPGQGSATGQLPRSESTEKTPEREQPAYAVGAGVQLPHGIGGWGYAIRRLGQSRAELSLVIETGLTTEKARERGRRAARDVLESITDVGPLADQAQDNVASPPDLNEEESIPQISVLDFASVAGQLTRACRPRRERAQATHAPLDRPLIAVLPTYIAVAPNCPPHGPSG